MTPPTHAQVEAIRQRRRDSRPVPMAAMDTVFAYLDALTAENDTLRASLLALAKKLESDNETTVYQRLANKLCAAELRRCLNDPPPDGTP